jgi:zinc protease
LIITFNLDANHLNMRHHQFFGRLVCGIVVALLLSGGVIAQNLKEKLPQDPDVVTGKLPNGLTYYIRNNHKPENKVELRLVVKAGAILEDNSQQGLAHFMEHMNFNGTTHFQKNDLVSYLQSIGVQFGADLNAYTAFDQTVFILPIPLDKPENYEKGMQIIEDWAHNALLTNEDIDGERGVVLEESRLGKGAGDRMMKKYFPKLAQGSLYAERLPIGKDDILKNFKYDEIRRFYKDWYRPDLQAVIVVGDVDVAKTKKMILDHFSGLKNPAHERERTYATVKPRTAPEAMVVTDSEATNAFLQIYFPYEKKPEYTTLGDYRRELEKQLILQMLNQKYQELSQSSTPPFIFAGAGFDDLVHGYEALSISALMGTDGPDKAISAITAELTKARQFGFAQSDLDRAKSEMLAGIDKMYNERKTTDSRNYVEEYIRAFLDKEPFPGLENEHKYYKELVPGIKLAELNEMCKGWLKNENTFTLVTAPQKMQDKLPTDAELLAMTKNGFSQKVEKTEEKQVATSLMDTKPTAGKVVATVKEDGLNATTYTLSNGIKVTIKPTEFKSDEILLTGLKKGGTNSYTVADRSNAHFATDVADAMGVSNFTPSDLEKVLAGKEISVNCSMTEIEDRVKGNSTVKDFESMLQLTYLMLTQPRKDDGLFNAYKQKQQMMLQFMTSNPQAAFFDTTVKTLYDNNPLARMVIPKSSDFDNLTLDRSMAIYKDEFCNADGYHFFIVGNINPEQALPLIETYLGSIPSASKTVAFKDNGVRPVAGTKKFTYNKGKDKKSLILAFYTGQAPYSEEFNMKVQALAEVLNIKVIENLREKMSDIYTGGFYGNVAKDPYEHYAMVLQLPCGPEHVDTLLSAANIEIKNLLQNGPDDKDLAKVKSQWLEKYKTDVKENKYWTDKLESVIFWGRDKDRVLNYEKYVEALKPEDVKTTAQQLFNNGNQFISVLYPES